MSTRTQAQTGTSWLDSIVVTGVFLAAFYWICESFMFFFLSPEANFFHHLFGPDIFEIWTRVLVLCIFLIFGSHVQYNINKRRAAYEKLREQDEKYRLIVENIDEGFFETDLAGNFTFFNSAVCRILGYSREELMGMNNRRFTSPANAAKMYHVMNQVFTTGEPAQLTEYELIRKDGSTVAVELSAYLMHDKQGNAAGFRGMARNVSDKLKIESEKKRLEKQLAQVQKMEAIGNLAGGIAHDFNNILMGMQGNASLMLLNLERNHPNYEKVKAIERYVESGAALTKQLLGFARGGKYEVKVIDLADLVGRTALMFGRTKKEVRMHIDGLQTTRNVEVDQSQIEQVLLNLFVNAWHAMAGGGDIYLKTEDVEIDETVVKPYRVEPGPYVCLAVGDTGTGMDHATRQRIFEPFFTTKEMGHGTGLGLASAYGIIKNHGGFIDVESQPGQGTTFYIYLPASKRAAEVETEIFDELLTGSETVLLVDDEQMIIEVGQEILKALGYAVMTAGNGKEAVITFRENRDAIDLVILDMIMPGMSGGETFDRLKQIDPGVKVLLCSGYSLSGQAAEILNRGCRGFIQKPFKLQELSVKLREILDQL